MLGFLTLSLVLLIVIVGAWTAKTLSFAIVPLLYKGGPFVPTTHETVRQALDLAQIGPNDTVIDVGSGDGRVVIEAAKRGACAIGYETDWWLILQSRLAIKWQGLSKLARIESKNLWDADLSQATVVFVYILPKYMERFEKKCRAELPPGARVVSNTFVFPTWQAAKQEGNVSLYLLPGGRA